MSDSAAGPPEDDHVSVALVDLLLTAALQWTDPFETGFPYYGYRTDHGETVHMLRPDGADRLGRELLTAVGHPSADAYTFRPLPGPAAPEVVLGCIHSYAYTALARGTFKNRATGDFVRALDSAATTRLVDRAPPVPWGLEDSDRDIFVRFRQEHRGWERAGAGRDE